MTTHKVFYITTPIYYVNDKPHIGHAYTTIAADILARWKRMSGEKVFFLTGTDEHGSKIAQAAATSGESPQAYVDRYSLEFQNLWKTLNISNDGFIRTTEARHQNLVQSVFQFLYKKGEIYKGTYEDWYCVSCESFWLESELVEGKGCPSCGRPVEKIKEENYFFKLSNYQDKLLDFYRENPDFLSPQKRASEIENFVRSGLKELSVSRLKESWGIPLPFDSKHTAYVWFDALLNYLTGANYQVESSEFGVQSSEIGKRSTHNSQLTTPFKDLWPADIHFVGKEIFRFHAVIWPAMLMALGLEPPKKVFAHGWWTVEGEKMSKSKGNFVDPYDVIKEFGVDGLRYFLMREIPFGEDGDFSLKAFRARYNAELANNLGNLFSRTLTLIEKNFSGQMRRPPEGVLVGFMQGAADDVKNSLARLDFGRALESLNGIVTEANRYIDQKAPWNLVKTHPDETERILSELVLVLRWLSVGFYPFMPDSALAMWDQIGEKSSLIQEGDKIFSDPRSDFSIERKVNRGQVLFPRKI